jgi:lactate permease
MILSKVMNHSGEITVLALGVVQIASPLVYIAISNFLGILGSLTTSSNTASNVLFAPLQFTAAEAQGLSPELIVAGQGAGGAIGNALAPGDALMGATVAGIPNQLGSILAKALPWAVITGLLVSAAMLVMYLL